MRDASPGQFHVRTLLLAACAVLFPAVAQAQEGTLPDTHTVREGDTLWDIAKRYFGDPFTWPQVYKLNTAVVEDPHWIYPGEVLRLKGEGVSAVPPDTMQVVPQAVPPVEVVQAAPDTAAAPADTAAVPTDTILVAGDSIPAAAARVAEGPIEGDPVALFGKRKTKAEMAATLHAYADRSYRPLRPSEFYASGFLTEGKKLPFGEVIGMVEPTQIATLANRSTAFEYTIIGVKPPSGAAYQVGDSLLLASIGLDFGSFGDAVVPTGIGRVVAVGSNQTTVEVVALYGRVLPGQRTLLLERFTPGGQEHAVMVADGVEANVLGSRDRQFLKGTQDVMFLDKGRDAGIAPGDLFEMRRTPESRVEGADTIDEPMGMLQVVRVGERTSTALVVGVIAPDVQPGTRARQVAKLPS
ncbi:MAG TPA: LysM peptidoglycan-binding domain-containing protein [Gemmatimonadales bacterium]|nr:LysM peptidoglycan-binding domain-containing protein [Gemmatimonadales bacterium]